MTSYVSPGVLERHPATIRRTPPQGTRQQDQRADHRFCGLRPSGFATDVGQAPAGLPCHGIQDSATGARVSFDLRYAAYHCLLPLPIS